MESLMTEKEVAQLFQVKLNTVQVWRLRGVGPPFIKVSSGSVRYDPIAVENYLHSRQRQSTREDNHGE